MPKEFNFLPDERLRALIDLFNDLFNTTYQTRLQGGGLEPLYLPAAGQAKLHCITFTRDYFSSALHEIAHWCIAGKARRALLDYGYWYSPEGRDASQQEAFERAEVKPQALERIFSKAAAQAFHPSADNVTSGVPASGRFMVAIHKQTLVYCRDGLPQRAGAFAQALCDTFATRVDPLDADNYPLEELHL